MNVFLKPIVSQLKTIAFKMEENIMEYRMKQDYLKNNLYEDNAESEKYLVEDITQGAFHKWNDKLEIITRVCDWYGYHFRFYSDGRLVMQMLNANTHENEFEWRGKDDCGHLEYQNIDEMLIDWLDELKQNEGSYKFDEEIAFIKSMQKNEKRNQKDKMKGM